ncbi:hypothetical protein VNI00_012519 [Paramarasmius palmivorus]|uniref:Uncharacterized protein n=1 Tax=Paramarasmius palmivorus TaxID=297713 RepID=A0AAW0C5I7_9AGAR
MTWTIASVSVPSGKTYTIVGGPDGQEVPGGDWSVKVSGTNSNWFYGGGGQMTIKVNSDGTFTITGGQKDTSGKVTAWAL